MQAANLCDANEGSQYHMVVRVGMPRHEGVHKLETAHIRLSYFMRGVVSCFEADRP